MQAGLVLNPETPVESALPYLAQISQLLLMTVYPGRGGQVYLPGSNEKIAAAKSLLQGQGSNTVIQVDGGITPATLPGAYAAGHGALWRVVQFSMETYIKMCVHCVRRRQNRRCL